MNDMAFLGLGAPELFIILAIIILLFGGKKLPELARSIGKSVRSLKEEASSIGDIKNDLKKQTRDVRDNLARGLDDKKPPKRPS